AYDFALSPGPRIQNARRDDAHVDIPTQSAHELALAFAGIVERVLLEQAAQVRVTQHARAQALHILIGVLLFLIVRGPAREHVLHCLLLIDLDQRDGAIDVRQGDREQRSERRDRYDDIEQQ